MKKNIISYIACVFVLTPLVGCDSGMNSQIEKCVQAGMDANKPFKNNTEKAENEVVYRMHCMKSAAGKD